MERKGIAMQAFRSSLLAAISLLRDATINPAAAEIPAKMSTSPELLGSKTQWLINRNYTLTPKKAKQKRKLVIRPDFISYHSLHDSKETLDDFLYRAISGRDWGDCRSDVELLLRDNGDDSAFSGICRCLRFSA